MTVVDWLILVPLIPAAPNVIAWWLPWERWIWNKVPKKILGPYLCYATFAAWYFKLHWWAVLGCAVWALIVLIETLRDSDNEKHGGET